MQRAAGKQQAAPVIIKIMETQNLSLDTFLTFSQQNIALDEERT